MNEINVLKGLDHPNIVRLHEFSQDARNFYLVTEFCEGGEVLNQIMKMKSFSERIAAKIMKQLLSAVAYCHSRRVVHRDLKPDNLVLETNDIESNIKVIDFGTSKIFRPREKMEDLMGTAYYIAPEVIQGNYNEKCDIWSCGIILYIFLCGYPPFPGHSNEEILRKVEKGVISFSGPAWKRISADAISFIKKMTAISSKSRITAEMALNDSWIKRFTEKKTLTNATEVMLGIENLRAFKKQTMMQKAVLTYMASHVISKEEEKKLREIFLTLDKNSDGQLSKNELIEGYKLLCGGNMEEAMKEVKRSMGNIDINKNGTIDYNEFLIANLSQHHCFQKERLKAAFDFFDADGNGQISTDELKRVFAALPGEKALQSIIKQVDSNMDGQISFEEFSEMMSNFSEKHYIIYISQTIVVVLFQQQVDKGKNYHQYNKVR